MNKYIWAILFGVFLQLSVAKAQKINVDSLFLIARDKAFSGDRQGARADCYKILQIKPNYYDAGVLIGRTYAWDKQYDSARFELIRVFEAKYNHYDAISALIDVEMWADSTAQALKYCNIALSFHSNDEAFLLKKAKAQDKLGEADKASRTLDQLLELNPRNEEALAYIKSRAKKMYMNKIGIQYAFEYFDVPFIRKAQILSVDYSHRTKLGSLVLRVNTGEAAFSGAPLFTAFKHQVEVDFYPKINSKSYAYMSYGFSPSGFFPFQRAGFDYNYKLPKAFESSAGFRFLQFRKENAPNNNIFILALTAGKYYKNWWFSLRSYTTPKTKSVSQSVHFLTRLYLSNADNYIGFGFGAGSSPDEIRNQSNNTFENLRLKSYNLKFEMQHLLGNRLVFKVSGGYVVEEYEFEYFRNSYNAALGFSFYL